MNTLMGIDVTSATVSENGHVSVQVTLGNGVPAAFHLCPGRSGALDEAVQKLGEAIVCAVEATLLECVPEVEDDPGTVADAILPCRICDNVTPLNKRNEAGFTFCPVHMP